MSIKQVNMKQKIFIIAALFVLALSAAIPTLAQSEALDNFVEKQFYGNRVQGGTVLLSGTFGGFAASDPDTDGLISSLGIGLGVGLSENVVFSFSYQREKDREVFFDPFQGVTLSSGITTVNGFSAGFRFLPNTVGGFVQPYFGLDYMWLREDARASPDADPVETARLAGFNMPVGVIFWISTFMSVSFELLSFNLLGNIAADEEYNAVFNADLSMLNPRFGVSFLLNGKKP